MNPGRSIPYRWGAVFVALALVFCSWFAPIQQLADQQVDDGLKRALVTFASARTLNGLISVVQGTEVSVQPLGVGVTLTVGQVLDPINDLVEQFSSLMLFASVAFGVQKVLLAMGGHWVVSSLVTAVAIAWAGFFFVGRRYPWLTRLVLILFLIRLAIPVATIGSDFAFQKVLSGDYAAGQESLLTASKRIDALTPKPAESSEPAGPETIPEQGKSLIEKMKKGLEDITQGVGARIPSIDYEGIKQAAEELPEKIIRLIVVFLMQTVALPLLLVWAVYAAAFGASAAIHETGLVDRARRTNHPPSGTS